MSNNNNNNKDDDGSPTLDQFTLSAELIGHENAVRSCCEWTAPTINNDNDNDTNYIVTGGQDSTIRIWIPKKNETDNNFYYEMEQVIFDHNHWVVSLITLPVGICEEAPYGGFVSGSLDKTINVYAVSPNITDDDDDDNVNVDMDTTEGGDNSNSNKNKNKNSIVVKKIRTLIGHEGGIVSFSFSSKAQQQQQQLLSGSWDGTARIWDLETGSCTQVLSGHENAVCVLGLSNGDIVTGSTGVKGSNDLPCDFQIRLFSKNQNKNENGGLLYSLVKQNKDHESSLRCFGLVDEDSSLFFSVSNDGTVRIRSYDLHQVSSTGHHPFTAEGKAAYILGACTLQKTTKNKNNNVIEIVSVDELGNAIVWDTSTMMQLQIIGHPKDVWCCTSLSNGDFVTGGADHKVRVFTKHSQRLAQAEVIGVFHQEVEEALVKRSSGNQGPSNEEVSKLPHWNDRTAHVGSREGFVKLFQRDNRAIASQWSADSQIWIEVGEVTTGPQGNQNAGMINGKRYDNVFPIEIEQTGGTIATLQIGYNTGDNPFNAAQEFIDQNMLPQYHQRQIAEYIMQRAGASAPTLGMDTGNNNNNSVPFNGVGDPTGFATNNLESSYTRSGNSLTSSHFPQVGYVSFDTIPKFDKILSKINDFNVELGSLTERDQSSLTSLTETLTAVNRYHATDINSNEVKVIEKMLSWPIDKVFPAIDICRLVARHPAGSSVISQNIVNCLINMLSVQGASNPVIMLTFRFLCNLSLTNAGRQLFMKNIDNILSAVDGIAKGGETSATIRSALSALLLNTSVILKEKQISSPLFLQVILSSLNQNADAKDEESTYKVLVGLGTYMNFGNNKNEVSQNQDLKTIITKFLLPPAPGSTSLPKVKECCTDISKAF